jgi:hypothetical protein
MLIWKTRVRRALIEWEHDIMRRYGTSGVIATLGLAAAAFLDVGTASAQPSGCEQMQKLLQERQSIVQQLSGSSKSKRKMTPIQACSTLGRLVNNGAAAMKFATANQDWCQIPASFMENMKNDNAKAADIRGKACGAAKQQAAMQQRAQQQARQQQQGANPFGGADAVTGGPMRVPQGAL